MFDYFLKGPCDKFIAALLEQGLSSKFCGDSRSFCAEENLDSSAHVESAMDRQSAVSDITPDSSVRSDESDVVAPVSSAVRPQSFIVGLSPPASPRSTSLLEDSDKLTLLRNRNLGAMVKDAGLTLLRAGLSLEGEIDIESEDWIKNLMRGLDKEKVSLPCWMAREGTGGVTTMLQMQEADLRDLKRCIRRMIRRRLWSIRGSTSALNPQLTVCKKSLKKGGSSPTRRREKREILYPHLVPQML